MELDVAEGLAGAAQGDLTLGGAVGVVEGRGRSAALGDLAQVPGGQCGVEAATPGVELGRLEVEQLEDLARVGQLALDHRNLIGESDSGRSARRGVLVGGDRPPWPALRSTNHLMLWDKGHRSKVSLSNMSNGRERFAISARRQSLRRGGVCSPSGDNPRGRVHLLPARGIRRRRGQESCTRTRAMSPPGAARPRARRMSPTAGRRPGMMPAGRRRGTTVQDDDGADSPG